MPEPLDKDACDLLDADHLAVKHLFVEYARLAYAPPGDAAADTRAMLARTICDELTVHAQIEEALFYPALRQALGAEAADVVAEAEAEHQQAKTMIEQIRGQLGAPDATLDAQVAELARAIEDHVKVERDELFPKARAAPGLDLVALAKELKARQQALQQQPPADQPA